MANSDNQLKKSLKQSQSMMTNSFNMGELLRNTTQLIIELLDAFDQTGPSNLNTGNNSLSGFYNYPSF